MKQFVIDASLTLDWCFTDEQTPYAAAVLTFLESDADAIVPSVWPLEVLNGLIVAERRKRITHEQSQEFLAVLGGLDIEVEAAASTEGFSQPFDDTYELARKHHLTAYDAAYLELALRRGLPLASLDGDLNKAAIASGVQLLQAPKQNTEGQG